MRSLWTKGAVEDEDHVVEEEWLEGFKCGVHLLVRCLARNGFDELLVCSKLPIDLGVGCIYSLHPSEQGILTWLRT
jgi:hypothetical protein